MEITIFERSVKHINSEPKKCLIHDNICNCETLNNWCLHMVVMCIFQFPTGTVDGAWVYQVSNIF